MIITLLFAFGGIVQVFLSLDFQTAVTETIHADTLVKWNTHFAGDMFWSHKVDHIGTCAALCMRMALCVSFNFDLDSHQCDMNSNRLENHPVRLLWKQNSVYSMIQDWPEKV